MMVKRALGTLLVSLTLCEVAFAANWEVKPSVEASETYTDNVGLENSATKDSDWVTEITPAISLSRKTARLSLDLDYHLQSLTFVEDSDANRLNHDLVADLNAELTEGLLFLDANSRYGQALIDARGARSLDNINTGANRTDYQVHRISPYLVHDFGGYANAVLRVSEEYFDAERGADSSRTQMTSFDAFNGRHSGNLSWGLHFVSRDEERDTAADVSEKSLSANLGYRLSSSFSLVAQGGEEDNDFQTATAQENGTYWAAGATWTPSRYLSMTAMDGKSYTTGSVALSPSARTSLAATYRDREVGLNPGAVWTAKFNHRTRRSTWHASYFEDTQTTHQLLSEEVFAPVIETDPVTGELLIRVTIDPDTGEFVPVLVPTVLRTLTDQVIERKRISAGLNYRTGKSTFGLSLVNERRDFLDTVIDNDEESYVVQGSWRLRVSGRSSLRMTLGRDQTRFGADGREDELLFAEASLRRNLSKNASGSVSYRYATNDSDVDANDYDANRIVARLRIEL